MKVAGLLLIIAHVAIGAIPDPSKFCLPDKLTVSLRNILTKENQTMSDDFIQKKLAVVNSNGARLVVDLATATEYHIDPSGSCTSKKANPATVQKQCLLPNANYLGSLRFGIEKPITVTGWGIVGGGLNERGVIFTEPGVGSYPLFRKDLTPGGYTYRVLNKPVLSVVDPSVFNIPAVCPQQSVVG